MDNYQPGHPIPACQVQLVWSKVKEPPKELSYMIHVTGVIPHDTHIGVLRNPVFHGQKGLVSASYGQCVYHGIYLWDTVANTLSLHTLQLLTWTNHMLKPETRVGQSTKISHCRLKERDWMVSYM